MGRLANFTVIKDDVAHDSIVVDLDTVISEHWESVQTIKDNDYSDPQNIHPKRMYRSLRPRATTQTDVISFERDFSMYVNTGERKHQVGHKLATVGTEWLLFRVRLSGKQKEIVNGVTHNYLGPNCSLLNYEKGTTHITEYVDDERFQSVVILIKKELLTRKLGFTPGILLPAGESGDESRLDGGVINIPISNDMVISARELLDKPIDHFYPIAAESKALELMVIMLNAIEDMMQENSPSYRLRPREIHQLEAVRLELNRQFRAPPSVKEMCLMTGLNRRKLTEGFKELFGSTITEYIQYQRMLHARSLLKQSMQIKCIAEEVGYNDPSSFTKVFKKHFGVLPREFC